MHHHTAASRRRAPLAGTAAVAALLVALAVALVAVSAAPAAPSAPRKVSLMLDWVPNPDHVALYWAKEQGLFAKHGVAVDMKAPSDPSAPIKLVGVGKVDMAISYEPELFFAAGKKLPVVAVAAIVPHPLNALIALPDSGIRRPADLKGRTVGLSGIPTDAAIFDTVLEAAGLTRKDVKTVTVGFSVLPALLSKKVDAIVAYRNVEGEQLALEIGKRPVILPVDSIGAPRYDELVLVANRDRLAKDAAYAAAVRGTVAAIVDGARGARADEAGAIALMDRVTEYKTDFLRRSVPATLALLVPDGGGAPGCLRPAAWQRYGDWMRSTGLVEAKVAAASVVTTAYLPKGC